MLAWRSDVRKRGDVYLWHCYVVKPMSKRGDVYLWPVHVVKPMLYGSGSPSMKNIVTVSGDRAMSGLRSMILNKVFLCAAVSKAAGV